MYPCGLACPDVHGIEAAQLAGEVLLAADQEQLIRVRILGSEPVLPHQHASPERHAPERDRAPLPQRGQLLVGPAVVLPDARVPAKQVLGERSRPEGVDAAFMTFHRSSGAVRRALGLEPPPGGPADVVPGERLEPMEVVMAANMPQPPRDDRLEAARARVHAGTGSSAGSSTGAGIGTGSSSGAIWISCSVSGAPMSIVTSWGRCRRQAPPFIG